MPKACILTINPGSSSLKATVYRFSGAETCELSLEAGRIGLNDSYLRLYDTDNKREEQTTPIATHNEALQHLLEALRDRGLDDQIDAIGQRVVHGGARYRDPSPVTSEMLGDLHAIASLDPTHLPQSIAVIEATSTAFPSIPQVACFDTAFHQHMPAVARMFPLPRAFMESGIVRYGFHGLSYEYVMRALQGLDPGRADGRVVVAHLGNGASMAAVRGGVGIDTTMGLTPTGGLMMGTRSGDLDPGVVFALAGDGMSAAEISAVLNQQSGLLGVSGTSHDMQQLLETCPTDEHSAEAVDMFCYIARKYLAAMMAALGGLNTLVFTGGIGEHASAIRAGICSGMEFAGLALDSAANEQHAPVISSPGSPVTVRIIPTNEDLMVARHTLHWLREKGPRHVSI